MKCLSLVRISLLSASAAFCLAAPALRSAPHKSATASSESEKAELRAEDQRPPAKAGENKKSNPNDDAKKSDRPAPRQKKSSRAAVSPVAGEGGKADDDGRDSTSAPSSKDEMEAYLEQLEAEVKLLNLERDKLLATNTIEEEKIKMELAEREAATERLDMAVAEAELAIKLASVEQKLELEKELADLRAEKERVTLASEISKATSEAEIHRLKSIQEEQRTRLAELGTAIEEKELQHTRNNYAEQQPLYLAEPLQGNQLVISDRRIALNGPIYADTADYVSERINYFNNKDKELPIFIVIDFSPGGSVMSGYNILKAIQGSEAPVHVVVKSYAASMAACIAALADASYAYPNAILLHHQLSGGTFGNLTRQREFVKEAEEWWRRLAGPVAEKMGVTLDEFIELMYENASTGDWVEFADHAKELKWIDHVIDEVRETSLIKNPDAVDSPPDEEESDPSTTFHYGLPEHLDENSRPYVLLPRLVPFDFYYLYNPDSYYRMK